MTPGVFLHYSWWFLRRPMNLARLCTGVDLRDLVILEDLRDLGFGVGVSDVRGVGSARLKPSTASILRDWFGQSPPGTVLDVGASHGEFAAACSVAFPRARIHSFEPMEEPRRSLDAFASRRHRITVHPFALGDSDEESVINVSRNTGSSSLLPMTDAHVESFPETEVLRQARIHVRRLDQVVAEGGVNLDGPVLMKLDVQGYEDRVLRGATNLMDSVDAMIVELSLRPLYEGQLLAQELGRMIEGLGFEANGDMDDLRSAATGEIVQVNRVYVRPGGSHARRST